MNRLSTIRRGAANTLSIFVLVSLAALALLVTLLVMNSSRGRANRAKELSLYCAAGMRYPIERIVADYKEEYDVTVDVQYGGSNTLLSQLQIGKTGDLYLAADSSFIELARGKGLAAESLPLAKMRPVIVVRKDSEHSIRSLADLLDAKLHIACGNPGAAAIGRMVRKLLSDSGDWDRLEAQITERGVFKPTVNLVADDVKLGSADAGIVWDTTAAQYSELRAIKIPEFEAETSNVEVAVLKSSRDATSALHFARYVAACDKGLQRFTETSFEVVEGDEWDDHPELTFFVGSVNRRAVESVISAFEKREGVTVNTVYNGCGILTGQMRVMAKNQESGFPDTYMACDVYYLETVKQWFQEAVNISDTDIVIAVQEGNPKNIKSLDDLLKPGMRVAVGQPDQCTIGVLTRRLLDDAGVLEKIHPNIVTETETSALLVPAVTTRSADAALAYRTDTLAEQDKVDVITLDTALSKAVQPFSIAKSSRQKYLGRRLYQAITRAREKFESVGFHWRLSDSEEEQSPRSPVQ